MRQLRGDVPTSQRARRAAWCLAAAIIWAAALLLPGLDVREAWLLLGLAMIFGVASDVTLKGDRAMAEFGANTAAILVGAGVALLARLLLAL